MLTQLWDAAASACSFTCKGSGSTSTTQKEKARAGLPSTKTASRLQLGNESANLEGRLKDAFGGTSWIPVWLLELLSLRAIEINNIRPLLKHEIDSLEMQEIEEEHKTSIFNLYL